MESPVPRCTHARATSTRVAGRPKGSGSAGCAVRGTGGASGMALPLPLLRLAYPLRILSFPLPCARAPPAPPPFLFDSLLPHSRSQTFSLTRAPARRSLAAICKLSYLALRHLPSGRRPDLPTLPEACVFHVMNGSRMAMTCKAADDGQPCRAVGVARCHKRFPANAPCSRALHPAGAGGWQQQQPPPHMWWPRPCSAGHAAS